MANTLKGFAQTVFTDRW